MTLRRTTTLNLRIDPDLKEALREAAVLDHRSVANLIEVLIIRHCRSSGVDLPANVSSSALNNGE